jgi:hypothetical protein
MANALQEGLSVAATSIFDSLPFRPVKVRTTLRTTSMTCHLDVVS